MGAGVEFVEGVAAAVGALGALGASFAGFVGECVGEAFDGVTWGDGVTG